MAAIKDNPLALQYVNEQTPDICIAAINRDKHAVAYISDKIISELEEILNKENISI